MKKIVNDNQIANTPLLTVPQYSVESYFINPKFLRKVSDTSDLFIIPGSLSQNFISGKFSSVTGDQQISLNRPQLADIESVTKSIYYDTATKKARAKLEIKMRNSSPDPVMGVDVRIAIAPANGGTV